MQIKILCNGDNGTDQLLIIDALIQACNNCFIYLLPEFYLTDIECVSGLDQQIDLASRSQLRLLLQIGAGAFHGRQFDADGTAYSGQVVQYQILELKPERVIFNPGTASTELEARLKTAGIPYSHDCTLVMLQSGHF